MFPHKKLLLTKEDACGFEILLIAFLSIVSIIGGPNTGIEQAALCITLGLLLSMLLQNIHVMGKRRRLLVVYLNVASIMITVCFHGGFGSAIMAMNLLLAAMVYNNIEIKRAVYVRLHLFLAVAVTFYVMTADISNIWAITDLTGNEVNPNTIGMFALAAYLHWICFLFERMVKGWKRSIAFILLSMGFVFLILVSKSRTSLLAICLFWALFFLRKNAFGNKEFHILTVVLLVISVIFPVVYIALANQFAETGIIVLGKNLFSGRQVVWQSVFDSIKQYPIFGSANELPIQNVGGQTTGSAHSMMLGYMKMFGIIPTVTIMLMFVNNHANDRFGMRRKIPQFAFLATIPCNFFENLYTDTRFYMLFAFFLLEFVAKEDDVRGKISKNKIEVST